MKHQYIVDILTRELEYLQRTYKKKDGSPKIKDARSHESLKRTYIKRIEQMEKDPTQPEGLEEKGVEVGRTEYQMLIKNNDGEPEIVDLVAKRYKKDITPEDLAEQIPMATAAKITPTRKRVAKVAFDRLLVYGDAQIGYRRYIDPVTDVQEMLPLHDERILSIVNQLNKEFQPPKTINLGDFVDYPEPGFTRFDQDSNHFHQTLSMTMQRAHNFYAQMYADNPDGKHIEVDSNHAMRPRKAILKNMPGLHNFVRPGESYPALTYYAMANLEPLGVEFISGYGNAEYVHGEEYGKPPIVFKHGTSHSSNPGSTVSKEAKENPEVHIVRGHGHRSEEIRRTMRDNWQLVYKMIGSSCLNRGPVPGYSSSLDDFGRPVKSLNNHQNTILMIEDYKDGHYNFVEISVVDGVAKYNGKEYSGE